MRLLSILCGIFLLLASCREVEKDIPGTVGDLPLLRNGPDTASAIVPTVQAMDSAVQEMHVSIGDRSYPLRLMSYTLKNGSLNGRAYRIRFDYHQYHLDQVITKELFADSLERFGQAWLERAFLWRCTFNGVRSNSLHFTARVNDTRTTMTFGLRFSIFYRGPKFGTMNYLVVPAEG